MKIDDSIKKTGGLGVGSTQARANKGAEKAGTGTAASDSVQVSSQLKTLAGQVAGSSVFNSTKVEEIKAAIATGQFQVDPEKIADGLMDTVKDLIHARKA